MTDGPNAPGPNAPDEKEIKRLRVDYGLDRPPPSGSSMAYAGLEFGGIVAAAIFLGLWLDGRFGTKPWIMLVLILVGMGGGMARLIRRVMRGESQ